MDFFLQRRPNPMQLSARQRPLIQRLCLLAAVLMVLVQLAHGAHNGGMMQVGDHHHSSHLHHGHPDEAASSHADCSQPAHSQHSQHSQHDILHKLMACDCLVYQLEQAPALAPAWKTTLPPLDSVPLWDQAAVAAGSVHDPLPPPGRAPPAGT